MVPVAARQRLVEATKVGKLKVPQPILDIEKRLKEDYLKRSEIEQGSQIDQKQLPTDVTSGTKGLNTGYSDEENEDQGIEGWDGFRAQTMEMKDYMCEAERWRKEYEAEKQAKIKRRQKKYQTGKINGPLEPLEGTWKIDTTDIMNRSLNRHTRIFRCDGTKLWGAFDFDQVTGIILVDPAPRKSWLESECFGEVAFLGGGKIMGCLDLSGDVEFTGTLDAKIKEPARTVKDMEKEWKGHNEKAHASEADSRWDGWDGQYEDEEDEDDEGDIGPDGSNVTRGYQYPMLVP
ncbi:MAG: hypothetical protein ASARMPRED_000922 [Alectoria sarmentosa]|nr:MAG: hypothetical protein ASARMPRED_000922 [Alectoria sarmentosa]